MLMERAPGCHYQGPLPFLGGSVKARNAGAAERASSRFQGIGAVAAGQEQGRNPPERVHDRACGTVPRASDVQLCGTGGLSASGNTLVRRSQRRRSLATHRVVAAIPQGDPPGRSYEHAIGAATPVVQPAGATPLFWRRPQIYSAGPGALPGSRHIGGKTR